MKALSSEDYILGLDFWYHDASAVLIKGNEIIAASHEERFSRKKHDEEFPENAINFVLKKAGINAEELSAIAYYEKPFLKFERILEISLKYAPRGYWAFVKAMPIWLKKKLWVEDKIKSYLKGFKGDIYYLKHHLSHAASSFYTSPFKEAAILTIDGVGEWESTTYGVANEDKIEIKKAIHFPHSLGLLYSAFTYYLGFKVNSGEYKVMGLAPFGKPEYVDLIMENLIEVNKDGSFTLNMDYFGFLDEETMINNRFRELFGRKERKPEGKIDKFYENVAASIQKVVEDIILKMACHVRDETGEKYLVMGGGVALNSVANNRVLKETGFENIFIHPAAGDGGSALGAALYAFYKHNKFKPENKLFNPYLGVEFSKEGIKKELDRMNAIYGEEKSEKIIKKAAELISKEKIIGWFNGRAEWGPRALGNRSILADPRKEKMKEIINKKIKFREPFRPFAPSVLEEYAEEYFDIKTNDYAAYYMLLVPKVKNPNKIKAVTHVDGTGRLQIVKKELNPVYYKLIKEFYKITGVPVVLNTSFNLRGEPIVNSPSDAYKTFMRSGMDALFFSQGFYLIKEEQKDIEKWKNFEIELD